MGSRTDRSRPERTCEGGVFFGDRTGLHSLSLGPTRGTQISTDACSRFRMKGSDAIGHRYKFLDFDHAAATSMG